MTTIQTRTTKTGEEAHRVGYYENGKLKWTPTLQSPEGAKKIKEIIETQGPQVALQILEAQQQSDTMTLAEWFDLDMKIRSIEVTDGTIAGYEQEAARTWMPRLGHMPLDTITRQHVIDFVVWYKDQPTDKSNKARAKAEENGEPLPPVQKVKAKTVRNAHTLLSSVLQSAVEYEHIEKNVAYLPLSSSRWDGYFYTL